MDKITKASAPLWFRILTYVTCPIWLSAYGISMALWFWCVVFPKDMLSLAFESWDAFNDFFFPPPMNYPCPIPAHSKSALYSYRGSEPVKMCSECVTAKAKRLGCTIQEAVDTFHPSK